MLHEPGMLRPAGKSAIGAVDITMQIEDVRVDAFGIRAD
jgi:hypothetical protein